MSAKRGSIRDGGLNQDSARCRSRGSTTHRPAGVRRGKQIRAPCSGQFRCARSRQCGQTRRRVFYYHRQQRREYQGQHSSSRHHRTHRNAGQHLFAGFFIIMKLNHIAGDIGVADLRFAFTGPGGAGHKKTLTENCGC